jgi:uncharacterized protein involved in exopolysaccharide biosynthesis
MTIETEKNENGILSLFNILWKRRESFGIAFLVCVSFGLLVAFTNPIEFTTSAVLMPEAKSSSPINSSLAGLAGLAGVDLSSVGKESMIYPSLYPEIIRSVPFLLDLVNQEYYFSNVGETMSLDKFFENHAKGSLLSILFDIPISVISLFKSEPKKSIGNFNSLKSKYLALSEREFFMFKQLQDRIEVTSDDYSGVITISAKMQDPLVAAEIVEFTKNYISKYITEYYTAKARRNLEFIESQYMEAKVRFYESEKVLSTFQDSNQNITSARAESEKTKLQSEFNLAFNIYNELAKQLETAKLKVREQTPVFTILEPVSIPFKKSEPRRLIILIVSVFFGVLTGITTVYLQEEKEAILSLFNERSE